MKGVTSDDGGTAYSYFKDFNIEVGGKQDQHLMTIREMRMRGLLALHHLMIQK